MVRGQRRAYVRDGNAMLHRLVDSQVDLQLALASAEQLRAGDTWNIGQLFLHFFGQHL